MTNNNNTQKLNGGFPHTLEDRIVAALNDPNITAADLDVLLTDTQCGLTDAVKIAERLQECAVDLLQSPDATKAREAAEFSTFVVKRLQNAIPRLQQRHQQVSAKARAGRWNELADMTQANRDVLVAELTDVYPQWVAKIIELFQHIRALDQEIDHVNNLAPSSQSRRLLPIDTARIAANTKLLDLSGQTIWPPPTPSINVDTIVPRLSGGGDWHATISERDAQRHREAVRVAAHYDRMTREKEDKENAAARAARARGSR